LNVVAFALAEITTPNASVEATIHDRTGAAFASGVPPPTTRTIRGNYEHLRRETT
jgi:hypothetical protein